MTLDKYKCEYCRHIEDNVFKCTDNHLVCEKCAIQFKKLCKCKKMLPNNKQTNPIDQLVKYETKPCQYNSFGCTWKFTNDQLVSHVMECKFRPYRCIGIKDDAQNYLISFEITSKTSRFEKIKFMSNCYNDTESIKEIIQSERCAVLTHNTANNFVSKGELHFCFIIKRKDDDEFTKKPLIDGKDKVTSPVNKPAANFVFTNKGKMKTNDSKKSGTIPSIIQPVLKSLPNETTQQIIQTSAPSSTPAQTNQLSSINANPDRNSTSPCFSPSINKDDEAPIRRSEIFTRSLSTSACPTLPPVQPYKNIDDKMFRRKYPENCLTKPVFKR